jgi:hypothetical protein
VALLERVQVPLATPIVPMIFCARSFRLRHRRDILKMSFGGQDTTAVVENYKCARPSIELRMGILNEVECAPVAQLDRAVDFESEGCRFESCRARQFS